MRATSYQRDRTLRCAAEALAETILPPPARLTHSAIIRQSFFFECSMIAWTLPLRRAVAVNCASSRIPDARLKYVWETAFDAEGLRSRHHKENE